MFIDTLFLNLFVPNLSFGMYLIFIYNYLNLIVTIQYNASFNMDLSKVLFTNSCM